jgi:hypothetical protein
VSDFYGRKDVSGIAAFSDAASLFNIAFESDEQLIYNDSLKSAVEISFDGEAVHGRLEPFGPSKTISWSGHLRKRVYVRKVPDADLNPLIVIVMATTR